MSDLVTMIVSLLSTIAIFLFGMHLMGEGLENVARDKLKMFFTKTIKNPVMGALIGATVTAIIQSSTATTVMVVGFVNSGLMTLYQSVGVIIGANVGTTLTGLMMTFRIQDYIPYLLIIGVALFLFGKKEKSKEIGKTILGFGLLFMGLFSMSDAMRPVAQSYFFQNLILTIEGNILLGILVGAAMTAILQSSTAATAVILSLASTDALTLAAAIPLIFGSNIGTCLTALISSINANKNARKAALIHLSFSVIGTVLFIPFVNPFTDLLLYLGGSLDRMVANAHLLFNIITAVLLLPFSKLLVNFANFVIKDGEEPMVVNRLDQRFLVKPALAFEQAFQESLIMYNLARKNLKKASDALISGETKELSKLFENEKRINELERDISSFLVSISTRHTNEVDTNRMASMIKVISDIERIGDHSKNIAELAKEASEGKITFTPEAVQELNLILEQTAKAVDTSYASYEKSSSNLANDTLTIEERIDYLEELLRDKHIRRLSQNICNAHSGTIFLDAISNYERIGDHSVNIAESVLASEAT